MQTLPPNVRSGRLHASIFVGLVAVVVCGCSLLLGSTASASKRLDCRLGDPNYNTGACGPKKEVGEHCAAAARDYHPITAGYEPGSTSEYRIRFQVEGMIGCDPAGVRTVTYFQELRNGPAGPFVRSSKLTTRATNAGFLLRDTQVIPYNCSADAPGSAVRTLVRLAWHPDKGWGGGGSPPVEVASTPTPICSAHAAVSSARATGGASIASAPTVAYGQQEFGNTLTDNNVHVDCHGWSYWQLPVTAGDHLTIDFEGQGAQNEALYPVGTNDFNVTDTTPVQEATSGENGHQQALYTAERTGMMPLVFYVSQEKRCGEVNGPYDFTVYVKHALVLSLAAIRANHRRHETTFHISVDNPDGVPVSSPNLRMAVQLLTHGRWVTISTGAPATLFNYTWNHPERGSWQRVRVHVFGSEYFSATSRSIRVKGV